MTATRTLHGFHAVAARLSRHPDSVRTIYVAVLRDDARVQSLLRHAEAAKVTVQRVDEAQLHALSGTAVHQGVVAVVEQVPLAARLDDVLDDLHEPALILVLDGVTDPHNLGACMRSADAFGVHAVVVPKDRAVGVNATVAKAASGAADTIPVVTVTNLARALREMKERGLWILGADAGGENIYAADLSGPLAWVLGAEGAGLRRLTRESCDRIVGIPLLGSVESLNVSVAAGICLYTTRQRRAS